MNFLKYLKESKEQPNFAPLDETESINLKIDDNLLSNAKIACYGADLLVPKDDGSFVPMNPKKVPDKAIIIQVDTQYFKLELFFDPKCKAWDSIVDYNGQKCRLSPDQFGEFFETTFYQRLIQKLQSIWPLSDQYHAELFQGILEKEMKTFSDDVNIEEDADDKYTDRRNKDVDGDGKRDYSASGRKIMHFNDIGVKSDSGMFFCWPEEKKVYRWSTWRDWKKIKPLCRMRFKYINGHEYGISLSTIGNQYEHRGFRSYDLTAQPPLQWLSKEENSDLMGLSIFNKFIRHCIEKIQKYISMDPEEIYRNINNPEKLTVDDIKETQYKIGMTLKKIIKPRQSDDYKWKH